MTHKNIKRFQIQVEFLDDSNMIRIKKQYEDLLVVQMKDSGYTRMLDVDPSFSVEFDGQTWKFLMTIHGVYVGKKKSWQLEGITQGKLIARSTPQPILNQ